MSIAGYRRFRITVGALVLSSCTLVFADIGGLIPNGITRLVLWLQFTPSLLNLLQGGGWMAAGCIVVIALTLLFGRVYCAMLCPLGVLMDFTAWIARRTGRKRKLPYRLGHTKSRGFVVLLCAVGLLLGSAVPLGLVDPYSVFGKITAGTLRPLLAWGNHLLSDTSLVRPVDVSPIAWTSVGVALALLAAIVISAVFRGRLWCNTACPIGAVLGVFSRYSWFRLRISSNACVACSMCERVCPSQCIDFKNHEIDHSRCTMCLDCSSFCGMSGIRLTHRKKRSDEKPSLKAQVAEANEPCVSSSPLPSANRRLFLASALTLPAVALSRGGGGKDDEPSGCHGPNRLTQFNKRVVLPPGARSLAHFQNLCTACQLCVTHCPDQVLRASITQHGLAGFLQPYQDFEASFCSYNCSSCSDVCPTGAIQPISIEERRAIRTGIAEFFQDRCVVKTEGTSCGACSEHCPTQAVHMVPWKNGLTIPEMDPHLCIGCGGCEFICPVRPDKAIIVSGLLVHEHAEIVELGEENTVRELEEKFPF